MGWLNGWSYKRVVTITNNTSTELTDFQVRIELNSSNFDFSKANADGSDIRFTEDDGTTLLSYWIEKWDNVNEDAIIWVKVPSIPANGSVTIYMYYGNPSAVSESDPTAVFDFYDDFNGNSLDTSKWTIVGSPSLSFANGIMTISTDALGEGLKSTLQHQNAVIEARLKWNGGTFGEFGPAAAYSDQSHFYGAWASKYDTTFRIHKKTPDISTTISTTSYTLTQGRWMTISLIVAGASAGHLKAHLEDEAGIVKDLEATDTDLSGGYIGLTTSSSKGESYDVDWFRVRKYAEQEPSFSVGSETSPTISGIVKLSNGTPVEGATVISIREDTFKIVDVTTTGSDGSYTLAAAGGVNNTIIVIPSAEDQNGDIKCHIQPA